MRWLIPVVLLSGLQARAHDADVIYALVKHGGQPGVLVESVTLTPATLAFLAPLDADGDGALSQADLDAKHKALEVGFWDEVPLVAAGKRCGLLEAKASLREGFVELVGQFNCGEGELRQDFRILRVLPTNYRVVLGSQLDGEAPSTSLGVTGARSFAQGSLTTIAVPRPPAPGAWDAAGFRRELAQGVTRGLSIEVLAALFGVLLAIGAWRRGLIGAALILLGAALGSWASLDWWPPTILMLLVLGGAAAFKSPPLIVPALLGLAIGTREGGGPWPACLGLGAGTAVVLLFASPIALAVGVMLQRRPRALRVVRWVPLLVGVGAVVVHARLSW
ncbi:MAG: hypothetical protein Q8L48_14860 [Archangium sp.]|nr:hypothetical protein [Archangium sp.]